MYYGKLSVTFAIVKKKSSYTCKLRAQIKGFKFMYSCYKVNFLCKSMRSCNSNNSLASQENPPVCL